MMNASYINLLMDYSNPVAEQQSQNTFLKHDADIKSVYAVRRLARAQRSSYLTKLLKK